MKTLSGRVAVVAGASRGAGRGIALALGDAGATVYVVGRTLRGKRPVDGATGTVGDTADEVTARGGKGIALAADLTLEEGVAGVFDRVRTEQGHLDVLANAVWGGNERYAELDWEAPFWTQPLGEWDATVGAGPWAYLLTSRHAAGMMVERGSGLIANVTDGVMADGTRPYGGRIAWDLAHACIERLTLGSARDLRPHGVAVVALMPGFMRTERVIMILDTEAKRRAARFEKSQTTLYLGRAVAGLAADPQVMQKSGALSYVADLAREYGFTDEDGSQPPRFALD